MYAIQYAVEGVGTMKHIENHVNKLTLELKRGTVTLAVLSKLHERQYGYSLVTMLQERGLQVEPGTLYPLLRRLEKQGLLESEWDTAEPRPRKYYFLSEIGKDVLTVTKKEWMELVTNMNNLLEEGDRDDD